MTAFIDRQQIAKKGTERRKRNVTHNLVTEIDRNKDVV